MAKSPKKVLVKTKESMEVRGVAKLLSWVDLPLVKWQIFIKKLVLENRSRSGLPKVFTARCIKVVRKKRTGTLPEICNKFQHLWKWVKRQFRDSFKNWGVTSTLLPKKKNGLALNTNKIHCLLSGYHSALFPPPPPSYHPLCCGLVHSLPPFVHQTNTPSHSADPTPPSLTCPPSCLSGATAVWT